MPKRTRKNKKFSAPVDAALAIIEDWISMADDRETKIVKRMLRQAIAANTKGCPKCWENPFEDKAALNRRKGHLYCKVCGWNNTKEYRLRLS
jgi:hypothetical protein